MGDLNNNELTLKLLDLMQQTGYPIVQQNGQRKYGPPADWTGPPPQRGCEVFIGKLPREIYEDELVPVFSRVGKIYELRLMMDFSGSNRGYAFVMYTTRTEASKAVKELNGYEIRAGRFIGVVKSVDNCRLFVGGVPKTKTKEEILEELSKRVSGIVDVIMYKNCYDRRFNRGFAFVEFTSHRAAAMARRALVPGCIKLWDQEVVVDWAELEPDIDDEQMQKVKVLYVRNFMIKTTPESIQSVFEKAIGEKIERVKKMYDYAFIHFYERAHAEQAMLKMQNAEVDGSPIEIRWAKPVDRELYRIQKLNRGNAKFNNSLDLSQTLLLYKQHLEKKEYANKEDEGIGSGCAGESPCGSPNTAMSYAPMMKTASYATTSYAIAPAKLDSMCKRNSWAPPIYDYQRYMDPAGREVWTATVKLAQVRLPLLTTPQCIGPLTTRACYTMQQAQNEAAETALYYIKVLKHESIQRSALQPVYQPMIQPMTNYMNLPYSPITVFMVVAAYSSSVVGCVVFLTVAVGLGGFAWSGFSVNHLDIAPPHASVLMGLSNTIATLPGIISPPLAGSIVTNKTAEEWRVVFFISSAIYLLGAIVYGIFCSGEKQPWVIEVDSDVTFDTETASVTTTRGYDNKAMDKNSEM